MSYSLLPAATTGSASKASSSPPLRGPPAAWNEGSLERCASTELSASGNLSIDVVTKTPAAPAPCAFVGPPAALGAPESQIDTQGSPTVDGTAASCEVRIVVSVKDDTSAGAEDEDEDGSFDAGSGGDSGAARSAERQRTNGRDGDGSDDNGTIAHMASWVAQVQHPRSPPQAQLYSSLDHEPMSAVATAGGRLLAALERRVHRDPKLFFQFTAAWWCELLETALPRRPLLHDHPAEPPSANWIQVANYHTSSAFVNANEMAFMTAPFV
ncbi:hypothetical protein C8R45DRAFT_936029 [Mycena sanguinolenta]|nr:hypothetical protein C8R45DRAFT_936029 [Mycena sanguinolenta]